MRIKSCLIYFLIINLKLVPLKAQENVVINWDILGNLPAHNGQSVSYGLAGAYISKLDNYIFVCGGSNFIKGMPWEGYKKVFWNDVFILTKNTDRYEWLTPKNKLKNALAYGACVSVKDKIVLIGGENENGIKNNVFSIKYNKDSNEIIEEDLPQLPEPLSNCSAFYNDPFLYVIGGEDLKTTSNALFRLDLKSTAPIWSKIVSMPIASSNHVIIGDEEGKSFYIIGGRQKRESGKYEFLKNIQKFNFHDSIWQQMNKLPYGISAGTGVKLPNNNILLFGGDTGEYFNATSKLIFKINEERNDTLKAILIGQKKTLQINHPGFDQKILQYDNQNNSWRVIGKLPYLTPVTTNAILWGEDILIISGEIKAGIRSPHVLIGKILN